MKIVIDTNIILSALIKNSTTRTLVFSNSFDLYYPKMSFYEIQKHKETAIKKILSN